MVALLGQLFYSTQIPARLWFLARDKSGTSPSPSRGQGLDGSRRFRDGRCQVLFVDAGKLRRMVDHTHRELTDEEITRIARTNPAWHGEQDADEYVDIPGFCKSATRKEIRRHGHVFTPGRYVGAGCRRTMVSHSRRR
jgi:type I restriction enzyme M protein